MKALFLHGAVKNSGDFLIAHRSYNLIKYLVSGLELISLWEGTDFCMPDNKKILDDCDGIIFAGGPFFTNNIYPKDIPLLTDLSLLKDMPMINIGGGWYGKDNRYSTIKNYPINDDSLKLLKMIEEKSSQLSCRDWFTVNMLKEKGFNASMNGCPAWYDVNYIEKTSFALPEKINTICISDPANIKNSTATIELLKWVKVKFSSSKIVMVYHRGIDIQSQLYKEIQLLGIEMVNISDGYKGFEIYDRCDLHIGFRVHAHIYNLSHRNFSILIEEDGRGAGVNHALGLTGIKAYSDFKLSSEFGRKVEYKFAYRNNKYIIQELDAYINRVYFTKGIEYTQAFEKMKFYYNTMKQHIETISKWEEKYK